MLYSNTSLARLQRRRLLKPSLKEGKTGRGEIDARQSRDEARLEAERFLCFHARRQIAVRQITNSGMALGSGIGTHGAHGTEFTRAIANSPNSKSDAAIHFIMLRGYLKMRFEASTNFAQYQFRILEASNVGPVATGPGGTSTGRQGRSTGTVDRDGLTRLLSRLNKRTRPECPPEKIRPKSHSFFEQYRWSSAAAHLGEGKDRSGLLDMDFWEKAGGAQTWREMHSSAESADQVLLLRRCTYAGRPFGDDEFVAQLEQQFQRSWRRWGFEKLAASA